MPRTLRKQEPSTSGEGIDLSDISLTGAQEQLIREVFAVGKPVVVILVAGKPFAIPWVKENIPAILAQWYAAKQHHYDGQHPQPPLSPKYPKKPKNIL